MPTYEYRCPEGHGFERFYRKMSDAVPELACPQCGKIAERQLTGGAGLVFKGSGFYLTDYGKNAHRKGAPAPGNRQLIIKRHKEWLDERLIWVFLSLSEFCKALLA